MSFCRLDRYLSYCSSLKTSVNVRLFKIQSSQVFVGNEMSLKILGSLLDNCVGINAELNGIIISDSIKCKVTCVSKWWAGQKVWFFFLRFWFLTHCFLLGLLSWSATADHSNLWRGCGKHRVFSQQLLSLYIREHRLCVTGRPDGKPEHRGKPVLLYDAQWKFP